MKLNKYLSFLLVVALMLTTLCTAFTVNAVAVNTFSFTTPYADGLIADDAQEFKANVKFDVESQYGFVGGDFVLELPSEMALAKVTAKTAVALGGGSVSVSFVETAIQGNRVRFIYNEAKTSLKSISFEITIDIITALEGGENYEIRLSSFEDDFKDNQTQNEKIKFDTDTKSVSVHTQGLKQTAPKPSMPAVLEGNIKDTSVTLVYSAGYEYKCNNGDWQTNNVFIGLAPNTNYYFYQRTTETNTHYTSESSDALVVTTKKSAATKPAAAPTYSSKTSTSVTLTKIDGYEYKCDNGKWQASNVFSGLTPNTQYYFYQRKAENNTHYASESSSRLAVKTDAATVSVPDKITSSKYTVGTDTISKISADTTVNTLLNGINEKQYCKVYSGNTVVSGDKTVGTGMTVKLMDGNKVKATYTITVTGDVNGDGKITAADYVNVKFAVLGKQKLNGAYSRAADVNGDGKVTAADYVNIKFKVLGKTQITPR